MKALAGVGLLTAAMIGLQVLAGNTDRENPTPPAVTGPSDTAAVELDADGLPPRIEYSGTLDYFCDEQGLPARVEPDTAEARTAAERGCLRLHIAAGRLSWPGGIRP